MQIIITETNELTELDLNVLRALVGADTETVKTPAPAAAGKSTPAKKTAATKPKPAPEPEPESEADEGTEEPSDNGFTLADAKKLASELVSAKKAPKVRAALEACGAKKVSELSEDDVPQFMELLQAPDED